MAIISKPAGVPKNIWTQYEKTIFIPYIQSNAARLREGVDEEDIYYLTNRLSLMLEHSGISGLGAEGEVFGPPSPVKKSNGIDWGNIVNTLLTKGQETAAQIMNYRLSEEALKMGMPPQSQKKEGIFLPVREEGEGFSWMTIAIVGGVALGGYILARKFKFI